MPSFRAAQIVGARFAFFVSLAHFKDRLKQGDGVFESGLTDLPVTLDTLIGDNISDTGYY